MKGCCLGKNSRGDRMIAFIETLRIPEGMFVGRPLIMRPWQRKMIKGVYDPVDDQGLRIVRKGIFSAGKKQGKTPLVAGLALGHLIGPEAKHNEQILSAAFDRGQSGITFRYMAEMIYMDDELTGLLTVKESTKEIYSKKNGSTFKALSSEVKGKHGLGPAVLLFDELAQFGCDRTFYDTLQHGRGAHLEPLIWIISTQAADDKAVLSQEIDYGLAVERGEIVDPTIRCFLFATPTHIEVGGKKTEVDIHDPENWKASNPALGDFLNVKDMEEQSRTAKNMPSAEASFRNLRLNQRIDASDHFVSPTVWADCAGEIDMGLFEERPCTGGLDLSEKNDLTALVFQCEDDDGNHHIHPFFWTPEDGLKEKERRDKAPYCLWRDQGFLQATPGRVIDYAYVAEKIGELTHTLSIAWIRFDRWRIKDMQRELARAGIDCWIEGEDWKEGSEDPMPAGLRLIPHGQGYKSMNPTVERVEDLLSEAKLRHGGHPVLTYCVSNTRIKKDPSAGRKFDKMKSTGRIDGMVAMAMALFDADVARKDEMGDEFDHTYDNQGLGFMQFGDCN